MKHASANLELDEFYERQEMNDLSYNDSNKLKKSGKWTAEEDDLLNKYVPIYGEKQWRKIADHIPGRSSIQCLHRWTKILKPGLVKGPWTQEEDQKLIAWVQAEGPTKWAQAASFIKGRSGKQCRERWFNNLCPGVKKGNWSEEEDEMIFQLYQKYGSSWSKIAKYIPGRTENAIKNRFYATLRKIAADKKKTCLENSTNDIKRELSDNFSDDDDESKTVIQKSVAHNDDHKKNNMMVLETPTDAIANSPDKVKAAEQQHQQDFNEDKIDNRRPIEKGPAESMCKVEHRADTANYLLMDGTQNTLYKLLNQEGSPTDTPVKEKKEFPSDSKVFSFNSKVPELEKRSSRIEPEFMDSSSKSKQSDNASHAFLKELSREVFAKKLMLRKTPSFQNNKDDEDDDEDFNTIEKMKKKFNFMSKNTPKENNESYQTSASLGLDFDNPKSSSNNNTSNQQDFSERNGNKNRNQFNDSVMSRMELNSRASGQMQGRSHSMSSPVLNGMTSSPKLMGESFRNLNSEASHSMNRRDLMLDSDSDLSRRRVKEETWSNQDLRQSAFAKRESLNRLGQMKPAQNEDYGNPYKKALQSGRATLEGLNFDHPQARNMGLGRSFNQSQFVYNQLSKYAGREAIDEEEDDSADAIQLSLADELLNGFKHNMNAKARNGGGLMKSFSQPAARDLASSNMHINSNHKNNMPEEAGPKGDDKITSLFQQLHSLESLLSTTRNELTKMDTTPKQEENLIDNSSSRKNMDFNPMGLRMSGLRREEENFNENFLLKRRF